MVEERLDNAPARRLDAGDVRKEEHLLFAKMRHGRCNEEARERRNRGARIAPVCAPAQAPRRDQGFMVVVSK